MVNKQTAVDWLMNEITTKYGKDRVTKFRENWDLTEFFELAKQMEKAQIIRARVDGDENHTFNSLMRQEYAEDYYKENYGKEDNN
jgi:hypothetical protein